jgi:glycosyltransferase involved in cell wall biosynthesis
MQFQVSVIIPCYRCADTIGRAVDSVLRQTLQPAEIILVEDFSDDAGATLAALYALELAHHSTSIRVIALENNCGPGGARNVGWAAANGHYLAFLDADDSWPPSKLKTQLNWMREHPEVVLTAGRTRQLQTDHVPTSQLAFTNAVRVSGLKLLLSNCFPMRTVVLRRDVALRFAPVKRYAEDYLLWLRIVLSGMPAYVLDVPLGYSYKAEFGTSGLSANLWKMELGVIDAYRSVRADGLISETTSYACILFSLLKFVRRLFLSALASGRVR